MFASFNASDAWKGIGATIAASMLAFPVRKQARLIGVLRRARLLGLAAALLVVVHLVPALDHVPKLIASPNFADAWRGIGSCVAILWFAAPSTIQLALF